MDLGIIYHDKYLLHENSPTHPERKERLTYTIDQLKEEGIMDFSGIDIVDPYSASMDDMLLVHKKEYLEKLKRMSEKGEGSLSVDTHISEHLWEQSLFAAGGEMKSFDIILDEGYPSSFAMTRPGGHHAFSDKGHGFCFTNNTAIAIKYAQKNYNIDNVLIWDWDAHHFDGTQSIFYDNPSVLTISTHQDGRTIFPGTGFPREKGEGDGEGYNINVPVPPMTGDDEYLKIVEEIFEPVATQYNPDILIIIAGQDCHFTDPITNLGVTAQGYSKLMDKAVRTAENLCNGKIVATLAGGYGIEGGLPYTNLAVIASLTELNTSYIREPSLYKAPDADVDINDTIKDVKQVHSEFWDFP